MKVVIASLLATVASFALPASAQEPIQSKAPWVQIAKAEKPPCGPLITCSAFVKKCGGSCNNPSTLVCSNCKRRGNA